MREIVFDTETTGLDPFDGHRVVEIGCIELINRIPTGATFQRYLNPERDVPVEAFRVHGLSLDFLKDKPLFADICEQLLEFFGDAPLIAHNASFDYGFICAELERCKRAALVRDRLIDTIALARRKHTGPYSLDALCGRYGIDNSRRTKHGALLDAEILAEVYLELIGARQAQLGLAGEPLGSNGENGAGGLRLRPAPLTPRITDADREAHRDFIATLGKDAIWLEYQSKSA